MSVTEKQPAHYGKLLLAGIKDGLWDRPDQVVTGVKNGVWNSTIGTLNAIVDTAKLFNPCQYAETAQKLREATQTFWFVATHFKQVAGVVAQTFCEQPVKIAVELGTSFLVGQAFTRGLSAVRSSAKIQALMQSQSTTAAVNTATGSVDLARQVADITTRRAVDVEASRVVGEAIAIHTAEVARYAGGSGRIAVNRETSRILADAAMSLANDIASSDAALIAAGRAAADATRMGAVSIPSSIPAVLSATALAPTASVIVHAHASAVLLPTVVAPVIPAATTPVVPASTSSVIISLPVAAPVVAAPVVAVSAPATPLRISTRSRSVSLANLQAAIEKYAFAFMRAKSGKTPRPLKEIKQIMSDYSVGKMTTQQVAKEILIISEKMGKNHPITRAAKKLN